MSRPSRYFVNPYCLEQENPAEYQQDLDHVSRELLQNTYEFITRADERDTNGELYVGAPGIAYAFYHASQVLPTYLHDQYLQLAQQYIQSSLSQLNNSKKGTLKPGLLCGNGGIIAVASVILSKIGNEILSNNFAQQYADLSETCKIPNSMRNGSDEFFVGRAGYLYGAIWMNKKLGRQIVSNETMHDIANLIVESGKKYSDETRCPCPLMYAYYGTEYLGAAHGISSILQTLLQVPNYLDQNPSANALVRSSIDFLLSLETRTGNYPCAMDELGTNSRTEENELVHWCHGAPGIIYLFAVAYFRYKDSRYLDACLRTGELIWHKGLLRKGPGICHGIAGNGYVFLLLYRLTNNQLYLRRALKFARFLTSMEFKREANTPDSPYSLYEGWAGTLCFLADLGKPESAAFPFQDPFL